MSKKRKKKYAGPKLTNTQKVLQIFTICYGASFEELSDADCDRLVGSFRKVLDN
jgi:hypothetical protein